MPKSPSSILRGLYVSRIPPFFREMPDRFTRVISSLFCKPKPLSSNPRFPPPLIFIILFLLPFRPPPQTSSREVCPSFSSRPHPTSVRSDTFQITRSIVVARYSSKVTSIDKHRFSWYRGK